MNTGTVQPTGERRSINLLARASSLNIAGQAVPLLIAVATVPMIVRWLGPPKFGVIALVWSVAGYMTLFDLGLGRAVAKLGAEVSTDRAGRLHDLVIRSQRVQIIFGVVAALAIMLAAPAMSTLFHVPAAISGDVTAAFRIFAMVLPLILITNTYRGALEAVQRFDLTNLLRAIFGSAVFLVTLLGAWIAGSVSLIVLMIAIVRAASAFAHLYAFRRAVPARPKEQSPSQTGLLAFGGWVTVTSALVPLVSYLDRFAVGAVLGLSAVAYYSGPYELAAKLMILPGGIASVLLPMMSAAGSDRATTDEQMNQALWLCVGVLAIPTLILIGFAPQITWIWLGAEYVQPSTNTLRLLTLAVFFNGMALIPFTALEARGRPDLVTKYHLAELPLYVLLLIWMLRQWGIEGAAVAWVVRNLIGFIGLYWISRMKVNAAPRSR